MEDRVGLWFFNGNSESLPRCAFVFGRENEWVCESCSSLRRKTGNRSTHLFTGLLAVARLRLSNRAISPTALWRLLFRTTLIGKVAKPRAHVSVP